MASDRFFARRSFQYGHDNRQLDRGQLVDLEGLINDEKLIRLGYFATASKRASVVQCGHCGAEFITDESLSSHGRMRHRDEVRELTAEREAQKIREEERLQNQENIMSPLYMDKTAANYGGSVPTRGRRASR